MKVFGDQYCSVLFVTRLELLALKEHIRPTELVFANKTVAGSVSSTLCSPPYTQTDKTCRNLRSICHLDHKKIVLKNSYRKNE